MDDKKTTHAVAINIVKQALIKIASLKSDEDMEELKNQYSLLSGALTVITELDMSEATRKEVIYELNRLKIQEVINDIDAILKEHGKPPKKIVYE